MKTARQAKAELQATINRVAAGKKTNERRDAQIKNLSKKVVSAIFGIAAAVVTVVVFKMVTGF